MTTRSLFLLPLLAACAPELDVAAETAPPPMVLGASSVIAGETLTLTAVGATPGDPVYFAYSFAGVGTGPSIAFFGGLRPDLRTPLNPFPGVPVVANASGTAVYSITVPAAGAGRSVAVQSIAQAGFRGAQSYKSNALTLDILAPTLDQHPFVQITEPPADHASTFDWYLWDGAIGLTWYVDIQVEANAQDLEDGPLDGPSVQWFIDGVPAGQGAATTLRLESPECFGDTFLLEVEVTDSAGNVETATRLVGAYTIC